MEAVKNVDRMRIRQIILVVCLCGWHSVGGALAAEPPASEPISTEQVAVRLLETTVTVRISQLSREAQSQAAQQAAPARADQTTRKDADVVTVCSGFSIGDGRIVTYAGDGVPVEYRVTLPGGTQAEARLRVTDRYTQLVLLETSAKDLIGLKSAATTPNIGATVLTAAGQGVEQPVVSRGILSAVDRSLPGTNLPGLLQCDVRTTETSTGAALVDETGRLVGIVVATTAPDERAGWTYAVPVRYVQRLLDAKDKVLPVPPRPVFGCTLGPGTQKGSLVVEQVNAGGPADLAGIRKGDVVVEFDGRQLRNVYQAVGCIDQKQPGETIRVAVEKDGRVKKLDVVLGSAPVADAASHPQQALSLQVGSQIRARKNAANQLILENANRQIPQIVEPNEELFRQTQNAAQAPPGQGNAGLARLVSQLQARLKQQEADRLRTEEELKRLKDEVKRLRQQIAPQQD